MTWLWDAEAKKQAYLYAPKDDSEVFIERLINRVDVTIDSLVFDLYTSILSSHAGLINSLLLLSVVVFGFNLLRGKAAPTYDQFVNRSVILVCVVFFGTVWGNFAEFGYKIFFQLFDSLTSAVIQAGDTLKLSNGSIGAALDNFGYRVYRMASMIWGLDGFIPAFLATALSVACFFLQLLAAGAIIYSKAYMAIILGLAPVIICCLLFESTHNMFMNAIRILNHYILYAVLVLAVSVFGLHLVEAPIVMTQQQIISADKFQWKHIVELLFTASIVCYMLMSTKNVAGALSGVGAGGGLPSILFMRNISNLALQAQKGYSSTRQAVGAGAAMAGRGYSAASWAGSKLAPLMKPAYQVVTRRRS